MPYLGTAPASELANLDINGKDEDVFDGASDV